MMNNIRGRLVATDCKGYKYYQVMEHIEVYKDGEFMGSADNLQEAKEVIE